MSRLSSSSSAKLEKRGILIEELRQNSFVYIPSSSLGDFVDVGNSAMAEVQQLIRNEAVAQRDGEDRPVYPHKRSIVSHFSPEHRSSGDMHSIEHIDPTTVGDPSLIRVHKAWPLNSDTNEALSALRSFIFDLLSAVVPREEEKKDFRAMQTGYSVTNDRGKDGDPGPEGVHQDSADLTAIFLMARENVQGGTNRIWTLDQPCGKSTPEDLDSGRLLMEVTMETPLDCVILLDRRVKHEVTCIVPITATPAIRDVLTFEVRRKNESTDVDFRQTVQA